MATWYVGLRQGGWAVIKADYIETEGPVVKFRGGESELVGIVPVDNLTHVVKHKSDDEEVPWQYHCGPPIPSLADEITTARL